MIVKISDYGDEGSKGYVEYHVSGLSSKQMEFLNGNLVASCLQQFADGGRDDSFAQRTDHTTCHKDIFAHRKMKNESLTPNPSPKGEGSRMKNDCSLVILFFIF